MLLLIFATGVARKGCTQTQRWRAPAPRELDDAKAMATRFLGMAIAEVPRRVRGRSPVMP